MNNQHPYKSTKQADNNTKSRFIPTAAVWEKCADIVRAGIERGFTDKAVLFKAASHVAHCRRGELALLDAHAIALDAVREALREVQA